jgi:hypothetical protein
MTALLAGRLVCEQPKRLLKPIWGADRCSCAASLSGFREELEL